MDDFLEQELVDIIKKLAGSFIFGIPIDLNNSDNLIVAAYHLGLTEGYRDGYDNGKQENIKE